MKIELQNANSEPLTLQLEPWGEQYELPAGAAFELRAEGESPNATLHIEYSARGITVYGWPGSIVRVFREGQELGAGHGPRAPVPRIPEGMTVSQFLRSLLERPHPHTGDSDDRS